MAYLQGIDVSHYQAVVDWTAVVNTGKLFAYTKATEGCGNVDPYFHDNWNGIKQAGLLRGAYHFFHANQDPIQQAHSFIAALTAVNGTPLLNPGDLPPTLDLEITANLPVDSILAAAATWLKIVTDATGRTPILYTFFSFWNNTLGNPKAMAEYPLWIARYTSAANPGVVGAWPSWTFWQYSSSQGCDGVGSTIDADAFHGTLADLNALAGQ